MTNQFTIQTNRGPVEILVNRKRVRRLSLRLDLKGNPICTAPLRTSDLEIEQFLLNCVPWMNRHVRPRTFFTFPEELRSGDTVLFFGKELPIQVENGSKAALTIRNEQLVLTCRESTQPDRVAKFYVQALKECAKSVYERSLDDYYPLIASRYPRPEIRVKNTTGRWGSASPDKGIINLSIHLMKTPWPCIESVVLHETAHFVELNHGPKFYQFIEKAMPDYYQRHRLLNEFSKR